MRRLNSSHDLIRWSALVTSGLVLLGGVASAQPSAAPGYTLGVFAGPLAGGSAPDSIAVVGRDVFVGYGNGGDPGGADGATSTIAEYDRSGGLLATLSVVGHNDGLRYDAMTGQLWAIQNEDANPNLVLINPKTFQASASEPFSATPHGGGYDDVAFGANGAYVSASNPAASATTPPSLNTAPAIVSVSLGAGQVQVGASGVLAGNATAKDINTGAATTLNLQDPDSLIFDPQGQLVLDSQADQQLVFIDNVGAKTQSVSVLNLPSTVDDTVFGGGGRQTLLFSDTAAGVVYALTGTFGADQAISAADTLGQIVVVDPSNGDFTTLANGLESPHGEAFLSAAPEPSTWAQLLVACGLIGGVLRITRRRPARPTSEARSPA